MPYPQGVQPRRTVAAFEHGYGRQTSGDEAIRAYDAD